MSIVAYKNFAGGLQDAASRLITQTNELRRAINVNDERIGALKKRLGYSRFDATIVSGTNGTGLHSYYRQNGDAYLLAAITTGGLNALYYSAGGGWNNLSAGLLNAAKHHFATFLDEVFITSYNETSRTFAAVQNLDNLTLTTTNNLTNATSARIPIVYKQRLHLVCLSTNRSAFQYSSVPSSGAITWSGDDVEEVRTEDGDELTGAAVLGDRLVLFKNNSLHEWNGSTILQADNVGTTSHRSIVEAGFLFFFSRSRNIKGFYAYGGGKAKLISGKIQEWCNGIADSGLSDIVGWRQGKYIIWYVGTITKDGETFSNSAIWYNSSSNTWGHYQFADTFRATTSFIQSSTERPYVIASDGDVHQMAIDNDTVYGDNTAAIATLIRTTKLDQEATEDKKQISKTIFFSEQAQGLQVRARADGGNWESLGQLHKTVEPKNGLSNKGYYFEFEASESSTNPPFILEGFSIDAKIDTSFILYDKDN